MMQRVKGGVYQEERKYSIFAYWRTDQQCMVCVTAKTTCLRKLDRMRPSEAGI